MNEDKGLASVGQKPKAPTVGKAGAGALSAESLIRQGMRLPGIRIDRAAFLRAELSRVCLPETVERAIQTNPAQAGIDRALIDPIANAAITAETAKVTSLSALSGIPGGLGMAVAIPADVVQYFGFILRILQKLIYLYGFAELDLTEASIADETMTELLLFIGAMFGVRGAVSGIQSLSKLAATQTIKSLSRKALTSTTVYPLVKKIAQQVGVKMTKQVFARGVSRLVPIAGAAAAGSLTFFSFRAGAGRLRKTLCNLEISDPSFYQRHEKPSQAP